MPFSGKREYVMSVTILVDDNIGEREFYRNLLEAETQINSCKDIRFHFRSPEVVNQPIVTNVDLSEDDFKPLSTKM